MFIVLAQMAIYIIVAVVFGFVMGKLYANAKNAEENAEKEIKYTKIISDKNSAIINLKSDLRTAHRNMDALQQGYELKEKLLHTTENEYKQLEKGYRDIDDELQALQTKLQSLKAENRDLSMSVSEKIKSIDAKEEIIKLLESKIADLSKERNYT